MKKSTALRRLIQSPKLEFMMEAHNGLSARIAEEAGFKGIWGSSLTISAALGVRDNNEASWTQILELLEFMADVTNIPILLDGDTGYGNFNTVRRLVRKLEQRGIAGLSIEDKLFPKTNSLLQGAHHELADMNEFVGKLKAAKDVQSDPEFCVIARTEAFIAGCTLSEVLRRAEAYYRAGADALLVHSNKLTPDEILAFMKAWQSPCPVIIVPTTYYSTPVEVFERAGVRVVIWANQTLRSSIAAMQKTTRQIFEMRSVREIEDRIVSVKEVFRLQGADELLHAEERYLPRKSEPWRAVILAASRGSPLGDLTSDRPKAMVPVGGVPLLHRLVEQFHNVNHIREIAVVRGYRKEQVEAPGVQLIDNDDYENTGELLSLAKAVQEIKGNVVISFGDILFRSHVLRNLIAEPSEIILVVDAAWQERFVPGRYADYVVCSRPYSHHGLDEDVCLERMDPGLPREAIHGEWIGLMKVGPVGAEAVRVSLESLGQQGSFRQMRFKDLFADLLTRGHQVEVMYVTGQWLDVDDLHDLSKAQTF